MTRHDRSAVMAGLVLHGWIGLAWHQMLSADTSKTIYILRSTNKTHLSVQIKNFAKTNSFLSRLRYNGHKHVYL